MAEFIVNFALLLAVATGVILILQTLRQPPIIGYILAGVLLGPSLLGITNIIPGLEVFAQIGIALLLFILGINIDINSLRHVGAVSIVTGVVQMLVTSALGYVTALYFGFSTVEAIYIAAALTFSSTIIIVKLLGDKKETNSLHGRIAVGFLIVQDVVAVLALLFIGVFATSTSGFGATLGVSLFQTALILLLVYLVTKYLLPYVLGYAAKNQEVLFVFSITWCFLIAAVFILRDFSLEIGALLAGLTLAGTQYRYEIASKITPLRDFFIILFFIALGAQLDVASLSTYMIPAIVLSLLVLFAKPLIVLLVMGLQGFSKRTSFRVGVAVSQISEFGLILVALGFSLGHISSHIINLVTLIALTTILLSTYSIVHTDALYAFFKQIVPFHRRGRHESEDGDAHLLKDFEVIVFGYDYLGKSVVEHLEEKNRHFLVVDFDPKKVAFLNKKGVHAIVGDAKDAETYALVGLDTPRLVVSTITHGEMNNLLLSELHAQNPSCVSIVCTDNPESAPTLYEQGATYVLVPERLGGMHISTLINSFYHDKKRFTHQSKEHKKSFKEFRKH